MSYAVVWCENGGPIYAGRLELAGRSVQLAGAAPEARRSRRHLFYDELEGVRVERRPEGRLAGRPTLVLERRNGSRVRLASVDGAGSFHELADLVAKARGKAEA